MIAIYRLEGVKMKLKLGKYVKGQEPYGCFNTGVAPIIARSKLAKQYIGKEYAVGTEIDANYHLTDAILNEMGRVWKKGYKPPKVKFYKTKVAAIKEFNRLNAIMIASVKRDIARVKELKAKANKGNMKAAMALSDY